MSPALLALALSAASVQQAEYIFIPPVQDATLPPVQQAAQRIAYCAARDVFDAAEGQPNRNLDPNEQYGYTVRYGHYTTRFSTQANGNISISTRFHAATVAGQPLPADETARYSDVARQALSRCIAAQGGIYANAPVVKHP